MPMHDWTRVDAGIFHAFHHEWISEIHRAILKRLPEGYYSLPEQRAGAFGPDVLTLSTSPEPESTGGTATLTRPKTKIFQETSGEFYLRKQKAVAIRHVSGDRIVAMIEIVSPGNKYSNRDYQSFVKKARELLERKIHLLIVDPFPPGDKHPEGLHFDIAGDFLDDPFRVNPDQPLSLIAYECDDTVRTYLEPYSVGDRLVDMPVYLQPEQFILVPLEATYMAAWAAMPPRWQTVIAG